MTTFPSVTIGEIAKVKGGKRLPRGAELLEEATAHPYLRIVDFRDDGLDEANLKYIGSEVHAAISRYTIGSDDVYRRRWQRSFLAQEFREYAKPRDGNYVS